MVLLSQKAWAAKITLPSLFIGIYLLCVTTVHSWSQFFYNAGFVFPLLAVGMWLLLVPVQIKAVNGEPFITLIRWRSVTQVPIEEIDYVQRQISVFDTLQLKSGERYLYITYEGNEHLRAQYSKHSAE